MAIVRPRLDPTAAPDIATFAAGISGTVIRPGDEAYETARQIQNSRYDRRPALIVRAADAADVARSVTFARAAGLEIAVRGGSHSLAGFSTIDDGIVIDLSAMKGLHIDPDRRVAWAQAGLTAGEYTDAAAAHGLATPFGDTASVGIAGLTLGGGIGWLVRKYGLTIDALLAVEIVTADGRLITASPTEHADLFWAVRGGGGNFGIVTRFQFRLYPVETTLSGALFLPVTREVLRGLGPIAASAPEELTTISFLMAAPPAPFVPEDVQGTLTLALMFVWAGDPADGVAAIEPFRQLATPLAEMVAPMPYPGIYEFTREAEARGGEVTRSVFLESMDDAVIDAILDFTSRPTSPMAITQIRFLGGAMARVPAADTAFAQRDANVLIAILTVYEDVTETPTHEAWTRAYFEAIRPRATGVYSNFIADEGPDRVRDAYPAATYRRLAEIKRRYDPSNAFRQNQNILPLHDA